MMMHNWDAFPHIAPVMCGVGVANVRPRCGGSRCTQMIYRWRPHRNIERVKGRGWLHVYDVEEIARVA